MGGQPSRTRKFTLENDDPTSVIKVSDDVVQRMRGNEEVRKRNAAAAAAAAAAAPAYPAMNVIPFDGPLPFHYEPSMTSLQIRQEAVNKMKKNDEYWEKRINDLQNNHDKMKITMEEEFKKAMDEMGYKKSSKAESCDVPCIHNRKKVMACYKKYPKEPMRCAKEVQAFAECVDMKRITAVENNA